MLYEYISVFLGALKLFLFKLLYMKRINIIGIPKSNVSLKLAIKENSKLILGKGFRARNNVSFRIYENGTVKIGTNCFFNDGCSINCQENVVIDNNVICGQNVQFFDHDHDYKGNIDSFVKLPIHVGENTWIGANCVILKGVTIGKNVVIAAGTIVTKNIPNDSIVYNQLSMRVKDKLKENN